MNRLLFAFVLSLALLPGTGRAQHLPPDAYGVVGPSLAAPFGIRMGAPLSELRVKPRREVDSLPVGAYALEEVPRPHPFFDAYLAWVSPTSGVCQVLAIGRTVRTDLYGTEVRAVFDLIRTMLESRYGPGVTVDSIAKGSGWFEPRSWMTAMMKGDRQLSVGWDAGQLARHGLSAVDARVAVRRIDSAYVTVSWARASAAGCMADALANPF